MINNTMIKILNDCYENLAVKTIYAKFHNKTIIIEKDNYNYKCTKMLFVDFMEPLLQENKYLDINNDVYKIIKIENYFKHMEIYLFYCNLKNIKVNGIDKRLLIEETTEKISNLDEKIVVSDFEISTSDLIDYQGRKWLVTSEIAQDYNSYRARMRKCRELKYNGISIFGLIDSQVFDVTSSQYFNLIDNQILITVNDKTQIKLNDVIYFNKKAYKVVAINDVTDNTLILRCDYDSTNTHVYTINLNVNSTELEETKTYQIVATVSDKGTLIDNPAFTYVVSDSSVCTVDNLGLLTAIKAGVTTIRITYQDVESVFSINVIEVIPPPVATYDLTNSMNFIIKKTTTGTFYGHKYLGAEVPAEFEFEVNLNGLTSSQISIIETTNTYIKIKNVSVDTTTPPKTIILKYREKGNTEWQEKEVTLKGIYG